MKVKRYSPREFSVLLKRGKLPSNLIIFAGEEVLLMEKALVLAREKLMEENWELNWDVLEGRVLGLQELEERVYTAPFACRYRMVIVREVMNFWNSNQKEWDRMGEVAERIPPYGILCLVHIGALKADHPFIRPFQGKGCLVNFTGRKDEKMRAWAERELKKRGCDVDEELVSLLIEKCGASYGLLKQEIERLSLLEKWDMPDESPTVNQFVRCLYNRDPKIISMVGPLCQQFGFPYLFRVICSTVEKLVATKEALGEGYTLQEAVGALSRSAHEARLLESALGKYSFNKLLSLLDRLVEADTTVKSGGFRAESMLESLVISILR